MALSVVSAIEFINSVAIILTEAQLKRDLSAIQCLFTFWVCSAQFDYLLQAIIKSFRSHQFMNTYKPIKTIPNLKSL